MPISVCLVPKISSVSKSVQSLAEHAKALPFQTKGRLLVDAKERTVNTSQTKANVSVSLVTHPMTAQIPLTMDLRIVS